MLNVTLCCVGKLKEAYLRDACAEYEKRLSAFCRLRVVEIDEERLPKEPSDAEIKAALAAEGKRLAAQIPQGAAVITLCIEGTPLSSVEFSKTLSRFAVEGVSHIVLIIGSSFGLCEEIKQSSRLKLSMSEMTFPHQLARVMLLEQLYRAMQIQNGGKYHK